MRKVVIGLANLVLVVAFIYGEYSAIKLFFDVQVCYGPEECVWFAADWHWLASGGVFLFVYLPLSPLVSIMYAWPGYAVGASLQWLGQRMTKL